MLKNLLPIYKNSILYSAQPTIPSEHLLFFDSAEQEWIGIPKEELSDKEITLLSTLYEVVETAGHKPSTLLASQWFEFLHTDGAPPPYRDETSFRFIQFHISGEVTSHIEIEDALKGFFTEEVIIIWENLYKGVIIEEQSQISLSEEELVSMSKTLESDLYVKISFFIGKLHPYSEALKTFFQKEKEYFTFGITYLDNPSIFTFERAFPSYLAFHLPEELKDKVKQELSNIFQEDSEMYATIKVFLENNLNASMTAKKLYIHRNTLQYRIDKFTEKTGVGLKDFYGAFTVYLACLLHEIGK